MNVPDTLTLPRQQRRTAVGLAALGLTLVLALYWILVVKPPTTWLAVFIDIAFMAGAVVVVTAFDSSWAVGYRPLTPTEVEKLRADHLVHLTSRALDTDSRGCVTLRMDRCRFTSRTFLRHRPWRALTRAVFVFTGDPTPAEVRWNISHRRARYRYVLDAAGLPPTTMIRGNALAITEDLTARVLAHGSI